MVLRAGLKKASKKQLIDNKAETYRRSIEVLEQQRSNQESNVSEQKEESIDKTSTKIDRARIVLSTELRGKPAAIFEEHDKRSIAVSDSPFVIPLPICLLILLV